MVDEGLNTLSSLAGLGHISAENGRPGGPNNCTGRSGRDRTIRVPPGTVVFLEDGSVLCDLDHPGQTFVVARGGKGGRGNSSFATPVIQTPRKAEPGRPGEERRLRLELKMIADVGLLGFPNAGKSTLLSKISRAAPRVAAYPFTTLAPSLGVVELEDGGRIVVADMPGLIEGAHRGRGLGIQFLRHIERTRILLHLVDVSDSAFLPPADAYRIVREELTAYGGTLAGREEIVVSTKIDLPGAARGMAALRRACGRDVLGVSAVTGKGLAKLVAALAALCRAPTAKAETCP